VKTDQRVPENERMSLCCGFEFQEVACDLCGGHGEALGNREHECPACGGTGIAEGWYECMNCWVRFQDDSIHLTDY